MSLKCILQGQDSKNLVTKIELNEHIANKDNPHEVTAEQVGAMHDYGLITPENLQTWVSEQKFSGTFLLTPSTTQGVPKPRYWFGEFIIISKDIFNDFAIYLFTDAEFYCCVTSSGQWSNSWLQIHPNKYHTNPNLLDNWYFINPVNQKGQTEYTDAGKYSIDRWWLQYDTSLSIVDGGIKISDKWDVQQYFENTLPNATYTLSLLYKDRTGSDPLRLLAGNRTDGDIAQTESKAVSGLLSITFSTGTMNKVNFGFTGSTDNSAIIIAIKLELGDTQTLAHQDSSGNWILNEIPDFGEQLRRCQRFFQRHEINVNAFIPAAMFGGELMLAHFFIPFLTKMRTVPTATVQNNGRFVTAAGNVIFLNTTPQFDTRGSTEDFAAMTVQFDALSAGTSGWVDSFGHIDFSADL